MKAATMEEIEGIRLIAEQKLSIYKKRPSNEEYKTILILTMREIAHDMGMEFTNNEDIMIDSFPGKSQFLEVRDLQDLEYPEKERGVLPPAHLLVTSDFESLNDKLKNLCLQGKMFSLFFLKVNDLVNDLAKSFEAIPVFVVSDKQTAYGIVREQHTNPARAVTKAIND